MVESADFSSWTITNNLMSNIAMDQSNLVRWFVQMLIPYEYPHSPKIGYSHEKCLWINKNDASAPYRSPSWEILHGFTIAPKKPSDLRRAPHLQGHQQLNFTWFWWIWLDFSELFWILWIFSGYLWMFVAFKWKLSIPIFCGYLSCHGDIIKIAEFAKVLKAPILGKYRGTG